MLMFSTVIVVCRNNQNCSMQNVKSEDLKKMICKNLKRIEYLTEPLLITDFKKDLLAFGNVKDVFDKTLFTVSIDKATEVIDTTLTEVKQLASFGEVTSSIKEKYKTLLNILNEIEHKVAKNNGEIICELFEDCAPVVSFVDDFIRYSVCNNITKYEVLGGFYYKYKE